ncbi:MAG: NAD(P)H-hydrate dehydratase [Bacteroidales bacterium]|jgi:NAD(P)H-hydrate epimerase|nr:NAD(P)H-hydrate dehydratase [Bacteroidales bacterium]
MFILTAPQIRESEQFTMQMQGISALQLMENAATAFTDEFLNMAGDFKIDEVVICCGHGNNGGDGLVIARLLTQKKCKVKVVLCDNELFSRSPLFEKNLERLLSINEKTLSIVNKIEAHTLEALSERVVVLDAIFGIGLNRPVSGHYAKIIELINNSGFPVISVDIPSGLFADKPTPAKAPIVQAFSTFTMQYMKLALLLPENYHYCGNIKTIEVGMLIPACFNLNTLDTIPTVFDLHSILRQPSKFDHKGFNGHGLLVAGSAMMPGAAFLATKAALRSGIGKITVHVPQKVAPMMPVAIPEAIVQSDKNEDIFTNVDLTHLNNINAIAIGCGLSTAPKSANGLKDLLSMLFSPVILDADALNMLAQHRVWLHDIPSNSILTPHSKEFERLAGKADNDFERLDLLRAFAKKYQVIVILKGANTAIALPTGKICFCITGNPGMATAGSGDVLTGILLALLAKGYPPLHVALLGTFLHGLAGDLAVKSGQSYESLIASDIIEHLGAAYNIFHSPEKMWES